MGTYTELVLQAHIKSDLPDNVKPLIDYFFDEKSEWMKLTDEQKNNLPDHNFFKCERWSQIGHFSSYSFSPFSLKYKTNYGLNNPGEISTFLLCNIKNYDNEIELFLDWLKPYAFEMWGYHRCEADDPSFFYIQNFGQIS